MKVFYIVSTLARKGPTSQLLNIISNLADNIEPVLVTLSPESAAPRMADFIQQGIRVIPLNMSRLEGLFFAKAKIAQLLTKERPDIIHTQGIRGDMLASHFAAQYPVLCTIRNFPQLDYLMTYGKLRGTVMAKMHLRRLSHVNRAVGVSHSVTDNLTQLGLSKVGTVHNGVETKAYFQVGTAQRSALRQSFGLENNECVFISTGHLCARKNPQQLIKAFITAFGSSTKVKLLFVGDGEQRRECESLAADYPQIQFIGRVSNVAEYLNAADVYLSSSLAEGLPNAVLEGMACGLPVILSDIAPHLEFINLNPKIGYTFNNQAQLVDLLYHITEQDLSVFSDELNAVIKHELSAASMSMKYQGLYHELVS